MRRASDRPSLRESAPFYGAGSRPGERRRAASRPRAAPLAAQPTLRESAPFYGAGSRRRHGDGSRSIRYPKCQAM